MTPRNIHRIHFLIQILLFPVLILLDQLTKRLAVSALKGQSDIPVLGDGVVLHYLENQGAAFGIFKNQQWMFYILASLIFLLVLAVFVILHRRLRGYCNLYPEESFRRKTFRQMLFLGYLFVFLDAGAIGNLIDRILYGYVIDFIYVKFIRFPVFNLADIFVTATAVILIIFFILVYKEDENFALFKKKH